MADRCLGAAATRGTWRLAWWPSLIIMAILLLLLLQLGVPAGLPGGLL
jgi:hypothetical protein